MKWEGDCNDELVNFYKDNLNPCKLIMCLNQRNFINVILPTALLNDILDIDEAETIINVIGNMSIVSWFAISNLACNYLCALLNIFGDALWDLNKA